ncbi:DUF3822 family protein [Flavobacterium sp.]|uniref:DUF3822 family protein n=1 Tax=Flavobacterium sp. TaxID=239 RepID=UPI0026217543|nr:DUF3822 family protein [Flavobacterium sp.]
MLVNAANITEKKYKKLTVQVSASGMVFSSFDTLNHKILSVDEVAFEGNQVEEAVKTTLHENPAFQEAYDEVVVLHENNLATFVPEALFDEQYLGSYMQYNTKVFETDFFAFDTLSTYSMNTVYVPYTTINEIFENHFGSLAYKHVHTILVSRLLDLSKNVDDKRMFVHMAKNHFEIIIVQNQHLMLFNSFDYKTPEDLIYYLLFTAEQLNMNPESFRLEFIGDINEDDAYFKIAYKYIRNVSIFDIADLQANNTFSTAENLKHFILFQS